MEVATASFLKLLLGASSLNNSKGRKINNGCLRCWIWLLWIPIMVGYWLAFTGCYRTNLSSPHFNTVDLSASGVASSDVRIGHFGVCIGSSDFVCTNITTTFWSFPTGRKSDGLIKSELGGGGDSGTEELVTLALALEKKIALFPLPAGALILAANVIFCMGASFFCCIRCCGNWPVKSKCVSVGCLWTSVGLLTISTLVLYGTLASTSALNFITGNLVGDKVKITSGTTLLALQVVVLVVSLIFTLGIMDKPSKRYQMHREEFIKIPKGERGMMGGPGYGGGYDGGFGGYPMRPGMGPMGGYPDLEMPQMAYGRGTRY